VLHAFWAAGPGVLGAIASRLLRVPLVLTLPGGDVADRPDIGFGALSTARGRMMVRLAVAGASAVNTPSDEMARLAAEAGIAAETIPLGVALDRWPPAPPRTRCDGAPLRLLHVANLNRVKDQPTLLRALALLERRGVAFSLETAGFDALGGRIQRLRAELGLQDDIRFLGFVPHDRLRPLFDRADLLLVSSVHEAGPLVMLEAAVAGLPTVGTAVGHIVDFAPEGAACVAIGDPGALAEAIERFAGDESLRLRVASTAQQRALRIDAAFTCRAFLRSYREVACGRGARSSEAEISARV
jgi:glycosyltransferase involved in cell wall biosynthesis